MPAGEASLVLSVSALRRAGALVPGERTSRLQGWTYEGEERPHAIVGYEADFTEPDYPWLRLRYDVSSERMDCMVRLVTTRPNYGGRRWWFVCPLAQCRAAKLYLPPGGKLFGSRATYGLPLIASIAADVGASVPRVRRAMRTLGFLGGRPGTGAPVTYAPSFGLFPQATARDDGEGLLVSERPLTKQMSAVFEPTAADEPA